MLIYHPMYDPHHCALRIASLAADCVPVEVQWDQAKVLDFFVTFPHLLAGLKLRREDVAYKKTLRSIPYPHENLQNPARLFFQLNEIQERAVRLLAAGGVLDRDLLVTGKLQVPGNNLPPALQELSGQLRYRSTEWYKFLADHLSKYPIQGPDGLKARSGLMEFRHDPL